MRRPVLMLSCLLAAMLLPSLEAAARGPSLKITNTSNTPLVFQLNVAGSSVWSSKRLAPRASKEYWATDDRSRVFTVRIGTRKGAGTVVTKTYKLVAGFRYKVAFINGIWDFRKDAAIKGPSLTIQNTSNVRLVFRLKRATSRSWDTKHLAPRATQTYWATDQRTTQFTVEIATRTNAGTTVTKTYRLEAGFHYKVKPIRGIWDFRR